MKVIAFKRENQGTGASRRLRKSGQTPGILYGGPTSPVAITLDHNALYHALKKESFHASILDMEIDGVTEKVLLRDYQVHAYKQMILHADFQRVDPKQKIHVKVPIHFINADISPAVKLHSAVISHVMVELDISCLPGDLPEYVNVDLSKLDAGQSMHVSDIALPAGVTATAHGENPTVAIAIIPAGATASEAEAAAAAEAPAAKTAPAAKPADKK